MATNQGIRHLTFPKLFEFHLICQGRCRRAILALSVFLLLCAVPCFLASSATTARASAQPSWGVGLLGLC